MARTFYFYDTETSGFDARAQRIMQFAGQRTDLEFTPIGEPHNILIKLTDEVIPEPEAIAVHGILPTTTIQQGLTEAEFIKKLNSEVLTSDTVVIGFNNIHFDDEFLRHLYWRNLYDPYQWHWKDGRSRWDLLDATRLIRALRPEGIKWPLNSEGKQVNTLVSLASENNLIHDDAHDALSDVNATIQLAKLIHKTQPKILNWMIENKDKRKLGEIVNLKEPKPFIYSSGRFKSEYTKTTIAFPVAPVEGRPDSVLVYDLRVNPKQFIDLDIDGLKDKVWFYGKKTDAGRSLPIKIIALNRCPAVAPIEAMNRDVEVRINLTLKQAEAHLKTLLTNKSFGDMVRTIWAEKQWPEGPDDVDYQLYDSLMDNSDKPKLEKLHGMKESDLADFQPVFTDERLDSMLLRYKARNFPKSLSLKEQTIWQAYKRKRIEKGVPGQSSYDKFFERAPAIKNKLGEDKYKALIKYVEGLAPEDPTLGLL